MSIGADPEIQTVWVDPNLFRLVFDNLVAERLSVHARRRPRGHRGQRAVRCHRGPAVSIQIKDHGHGMEPEVRERALDPFFTTRPSGTGLGLPIVQRIVEAHGGELLIESEEGAGHDRDAVLAARRARRRSACRGRLAAPSLGVRGT